MSNDFLQDAETEILLKTFAEETSKIPLIVEGKVFYASLVYDYIYRYGLSIGFLANFLSVSEEGLASAIADFVDELKAKVNSPSAEELRWEIRSSSALQLERLIENYENQEKPNKTSESD